MAYTYTYTYTYRPLEDTYGYQALGGMLIKVLVQCQARSPVPSEFMGSRRVHYVHVNY